MKLIILWAIAGGLGWLATHHWAGVLLGFWIADTYILTSDIKKYLDSFD